MHILLEHYHEIVEITKHKIETYFEERDLLIKVYDKLDGEVFHRIELNGYLITEKMIALILNVETFEFLCNNYSEETKIGYDVEVVDFIETFRDKNIPLESIIESVDLLTRLPEHLIPRKFHEGYWLIAVTAEFQLLASLFLTYTNS